MSLLTRWEELLVQVPPADRDRASRACCLAAIKLGAMLQRRDFIDWTSTILPSFQDMEVKVDVWERRQKALRELEAFDQAERFLKGYRTLLDTHFPQAGHPKRWLIFGRELAQTGRLMGRLDLVAKGAVVAADLNDLGEGEISSEIFIEVALAHAQHLPQENSWEKLLQWMDENDKGHYRDRAVRSMVEMIASGSLAMTLDQADELCHSIRDPIHRAQALADVGKAWADRSEPDRAMSVLEAATALADNLPRKDRIPLLARIVEAFEQAGKQFRAQQLFQETLKSLVAEKDPLLMTRLSLPIIRCMVNSSVSGEASKVLTSTARVLPFISDPPTRLRAMQEFLEGARSLDLNEQAGLLRELPIAEVGRGLNTVQLCNMTAFVGSAYCHLENRDVAQGLYIQATRLMEQVQDPAGLLFCYLSLAPLEMDLEDWGMLPKFTAPTGMTVEVATLDEASLEKVPTQVMEKTRKNLWDVGICHGIHEAMLVPAIRAFHTQEPETPVMILTVRRPLWWQTALNFKVSFTQMEANWSTPEALPMDPQVLHFAVLAFIEGAGRSLVIVDSLADLKKALPFSQVMELVQTFRDLTQKAKAGLLFSVDQHSFTEEEQLVLASKIQMLEI